MRRRLSNNWIGWAPAWGGLIGMALAGQPGLPLPAPIRRLVLNDVGPVIEWSALERIGQYLGKGLHFEILNRQPMRCS